MRKLMSKHCRGTRVHAQQRSDSPRNNISAANVIKLSLVWLKEEVQADISWTVRAVNAQVAPLLSLSFCDNLLHSLTPSVMMSAVNIHLCHCVIIVCNVTFS